MSHAAGERWFMQQALALGARGECRTSPNPRVGCLVVREGIIVGAGYHRAPGEPHAEAAALDDAGLAARGATLYVNLEPCAHHGRTPPCTERIVAAGVQRVVAAIGDPNPLVDGRGFRELRAAGIAVSVGLMADDARRLNRSFLTFYERSRPFVTVKAGMSLDGQIAAASGSSRWVTGVAARRFAHRLRARNDAILVGAGTVRRDDPRLDSRLPNLPGPRLRAVLAPTLDLEPRSQIFTSTRNGVERTRVYTRTPAPAARREAFAGLADLVEVADRDQGLDLNEVLANLAADGIQSLLVEGGGKTNAAFLAAGLVDELVLFVSGELFGSRGATPLIDGVTIAAPGDGFRIAAPRLLALGGDWIHIGRPVIAGRPERGSCSPG